MSPSLPSLSRPDADAWPTLRLSRKARSLAWLGVVLLLAVASGLRSKLAASSMAAPTSPVSSGDQVCANCHQAIYASYQRTSMAQGSGSVAAGNPPSGEFPHKPSGILYRVFDRQGSAFLSYDRAAKPIEMMALDHAATSSPAAAAPLHGERRLEYFIGSGKHGRTYLYQVDGTWFEIPINYYTRRQAWGMAPAFDKATTMPADLPADPGCLRCHTTGVASPTAGSRSHYPGRPFAQYGIGCSSCHGDPTAHLAANGHGPIVNPGKLDPSRRDSACLSCHLEGDAVVFRAGKSLARFQPGEDLSAIAVYFVRASAAGGGGRASSQYEGLLRSACKRAAGDRLTCTSCHDPHSSPTEVEKVSYYRAKCLACHSSPAMATAHHPEQPDCASCHMPARATTDISHEQSVDHDIERIPASLEAAAPRTGEKLLAVGGWSASDRELGLAYGQMAGRGDRQAGERALALLVRAEAAGADDPALHAQLGFLRQVSGDRDAARSEYLLTLKENPFDPLALSNLAVLDATGGSVADATALLDRLITADPTQTRAGLNLAFIECRLGQPAKALATLATLAQYNLDDPSLRTLKERGNLGGQHCDLPQGEPAHAKN